MEIRGGTIIAVGRGAAPQTPDIVHDGLVAPGLFDLQLNGAAGVTVAGGESALRRIERTLLRHGVTRCLATVITCEEQVALKAVRAIEARVADPASPIVGLHLEGLFPSGAHARTHQPAHLTLAAARLTGYYQSDGRQR